MISYPLIWDEGTRLRDEPSSYLFLGRHLGGEQLKMRSEYIAERG